MKTLFALIVLGIGLSLASVPLLAQDPKQPDADHLQEAERLLEELEASLFSQGSSSEEQNLLEAIHEDLDSVDFSDDPKGQERIDSIFGTNPLTGERNPLLTKEHRTQWLAKAISNVGLDTLQGHLREQQVQLQKGSVNRADWYEHVGSCTRVCSPVVVGLLTEHVHQVSSLPHLLLTFPTNSASLAGSQNDLLTSFIQDHGKSGTRFLLIGRASRTGNRLYNRELSARRVQSVLLEVDRLGVEDSQISSFWLGYEPPQITDEIARRYQIDPALDPLSRNQSVMLVAF